ncbi:MAG: chemotaxis protein CheR [Bacteroidetes bacterium]|nr:chemotaxis protein CheR [Bacteroidota bacterium]
MAPEIKSPSLSNSDFKRLSSFIYKECGIKIPDSKKVMVEARLRRRLRELNMNSYDEYCNALFSKQESSKEIVNMIDVITTNKTDFFREPKQFVFLSETALPELIELDNIGISRPLNIWSAGCSSGEEPYTLAIVLNEFMTNIKRYSYKIFATDISTRILEKAVLGVYEESRISTIPNEMVKKYFLKSKDKTKKLVRVVPVLRNSVQYQWLNFMDDDFGIKEKFDVIFCRNVIIYFDKPTQDKLIARLLGYLNPGGYLFLGHSESIFNSNLPIVQLAASTYRKIL